jgi:hypothetical protein
MGIDFQKIKHAVEQRDEYLSQHPELIPLQIQINKLLNNAGNNKRARNIALQLLMLETWSKIEIINL